MQHFQIPTARATPWAERYGERHRLRRVDQWPAGIKRPEKVRVYRRHDHFVLQWWEPSARRNLSDRVEGDLIDAVARAREVDDRLCAVGRSGRSRGKLRHAELVDRFTLDLDARADAGVIAPRTVDRYRAALGHYLAFTAGDGAAAAGVGPYATGADRALAMGFAKFLSTRPVRAAAAGRTAARTMKPAGAQFVWDAVRALYQWAGDPGRGGLLPDGFRNPFLLRGESGRPRRAARDPFGEGDVTTAMAARFLRACDRYQLRLFAPIVFYGLRVAEPAYLFFDYVDDRWLRVPCNESIGYATKGRRGKQLPLLDPIRRLLAGPAGRPSGSGLLYLRRRVAEGRERPALLGRSMAELAAEIERRLAAEGGRVPARRRALIRDRVLADAGAINYDHVAREFRAVASALGWPAAATAKDFRHLFATTLAAGGMPEPYRQYLMGHAPTGAVIGVYTHLNRLRESYESAIGKEWEGLIEIVDERSTRD